MRGIRRGVKCLFAIGENELCHSRSMAVFSDLLVLFLCVPHGKRLMTGMECGFECIIVLVAPQLLEVKAPVGSK